MTVANFAGAVNTLDQDMVDEEADNNEEVCTAWGTQRHDLPVCVPFDALLPLCSQDAGDLHSQVTDYDKAKRLKKLIKALTSNLSLSSVYRMQKRVMYVPRRPVVDLQIHPPGTGSQLECLCS